MKNPFSLRAEGVAVELPPGAYVTAPPKRCPGQRSHYLIWEDVPRLECWRLVCKQCGALFVVGEYTAPSVIRGPA